MFEKHEKWTLITMTPTYIKLLQILTFPQLFLTILRDLINPHKIFATAKSKLKKNKTKVFQVAHENLDAINSCNAVVVNRISNTEAYHVSSSGVEHSAVFGQRRCLTLRR